MLFKKHKILKTYFFRSWKFFSFENFHIFENFQLFEKSKILRFFLKKIFPQNRLMKNNTKHILCSNFFENKYFFINPKAKVAPTSLLSKTPKNMTNGPKLEKLSHFFVRGGLLIRRHTLFSYNSFWPKNFLRNPSTNRQEKTIDQSNF